MEAVIPMNEFMELTEDDLMVIDGGVNWAVVAAGTGIVLGAAALAVSAGLAFVPVAVILGAGTSGEIALAGLTVAASGIGGATIGYGFSH
ncbi:hypothetical protein SAMN02745195_01999 [Thermoanaerobacter uzonensis DSM 18761]|uniref:Uncharacterized protein n=1 Tax=Thermoanaerobacter uzonensis DSM 18761 TaxID=1123369 RepID=A0A1M4ZG46_9THEO|nr:hypothetical protein [Thermoanaerobacter uzonensis]SHF16955.1 hypothetical protein SAMN02745195_01999 [Thermoanaerobacter uzonensis DSM 18761]